MRRLQRLVLLTTLAVIAPVLAGCADGFDMDKLDVFHLNDKKKLPGERQPLFPEGVPGVTQGVPQEYLKGNQPPSDSALLAPDATPAAGAPGADAKQAAAVPAEEPKAKAAAKPKPNPKPKKIAKRAAPKPQAAPVQPAAQQPASAPAAAPAPWPEPAQNQNAGSSPWPAAPPPGTFTR
jgi:hypothetical protein